MSKQKDTNTLEVNAEFLKALAHPVRLCILKNLIENECSNVSSMKSCLSLPQSTVSQHLSKLKSAGLITGKRNGLEIKYSIADTRVVKILNALEED